MRFWLWTMAYVPHLATLSSEKTEQDLMDALLVALNEEGYRQLGAKGV